MAPKLTDLELAAIKFVDAIAKTQIDHPEWSDIENGLDYKEIRPWRALRREARKVIRTGKAR
jgi:hypothetical protein